MKGDTQVLGEMKEEKGQEEDLREEGNIVIQDKTVKKEAKEEEEETSEEETSIDDDVKLLKEENEKLKKQVKDKESFIGKQSTEIGNMRDALTKVKDATTPSEKKEAKDEFEQTYEEQKLSLINQGYSEKEAETALKPFVKMIEAAEKRMERKTLKITAQEKLEEIGEYIEKSGDFDLDVFKSHQNEILDEFGKYSEVYRSTKPKEVLRKAYKSVVRDLADNARKTRKQKDEETRDNDINSQKGTPPKSKSKAEENGYSAENILKASSGNIF